MFNSKSFIILMLFYSISFSQGPNNGFGIGSEQEWNSSSQNGIASTGLVPSFKNRVSLSNPSTWNNLSFTYLSITYGDLQSELHGANQKNKFSLLKSAQFIVPIKNKYAIGIELHPYSYQNIVLSDTVGENLVISEDTLSINRQYEQAGGIMALDLSLSSIFYKDFNIGIEFELLFGSARTNNRLYVDNIPYTQSSRLSYNGFNTYLYLTKYVNKVSFYSKLGFSLRPMSVVLTQTYPFDDTNLNGYHDNIYSFLQGSDFPSINDVPPPTSSKLEDIHNISYFGIGIAAKLSKRAQFSIEYDNKKDDSKISSELPNSFNYRIYNDNSISIGLINFPSKNSFSFFDNFILRTGLKYSSRDLDSEFFPNENDYNNAVRVNNGYKIKQIGYSIGFGYKFKTVGNQIDFTYYLGSRDYPMAYGKENIRRFNIGISIADIWFIKRRQR